MGMSRLTAYIISSNPDVRAAAGGPGENGKYMGWITLGEADRFRPLLNSKAIYDTKELAEEAMEEVILNTKESVEKELDGKDPITHVMSEAGSGQEEIDMVKKVVTAARAHKTK